MTGRTGEARLRELQAAEIEQLQQEARAVLRGRLAGDDSTVWQDAEGLDAWVAGVSARSLRVEAAVRRAAGVVLASQLVRDLGLEWVEDSRDGELGVRSPLSTIVFYPHRMVQSQVDLWQQQADRSGEPSQELRLGWLVASTRDYLKNLLRFYPNNPDANASSRK